MAETVQFSREASDGAPDTWLRGNRVAWLTKYGWSCTHRAFESGVTFCSRRIPANAQAPHPGQTDKCSRCERMFANSQRSRRERHEQNR